MSNVSTNQQHFETRFDPELCYATLSSSVFFKVCPCCLQWYFERRNHLIWIPRRT